MKPYPLWYFIPFCVCGTLMGVAVAEVFDTGLTIKPIVTLMMSLALWFFGRELHHRWFAARYEEINEQMRQMRKWYGRE